MSAIKFSQLTTLTSGTSDTIFPVVQGGKNWKISLDTIKNYVGAPTWSSITNKPNFWEGTFNGGDYNSLINKPTIPVIPTLVSAFTNDRNYLTSVDYGIITNSPILSAVATSGHYEDLLDTPILATVSTSGSYLDLSHTPVIPTDISQLTDSTHLLGQGSLSLPTNAVGVLKNNGSGTLTWQPLALVATSGLYSDLAGRPDLSNIGSVKQADTAPAASTSTLWYDTVGGRSYVYYDSSWVDASPMPAIDTTQLVNNGYSLNIDSAGVVNLPTFSGSPSIAIVQTASAGISLNVNGTYFNFNQNGSLTWPDTSVQTGSSISVTDLKTLVAASTSFEDFQARIAAL